MNRSIAILGLALVFGLAGCDQLNQAPTKQQAASGVAATSVKVQTQASGLTTEQENVARRLTEDNKPGAIKHLYVISAYSGDVLIYSTVRGKVTSSGKRLTPTSVSAIAGQYNNQGDFVPVNIGGNQYRTSEVLQDDGTYGSSAEYIYWWDTRGVYHQHYISGGQIVTISSQPLAVRHIVLNFEAVQGN